MTVEIVFRTSFCAVPAFIRVEPAITSGPTTTVDGVLDGGGERRDPGTQTTPTVSAPAARAAASASEDVGRPSARRQGDDGVSPSPRAADTSSGSPGDRVVLERLVLGDEREHEPRLDPEGRPDTRRRPPPRAGRRCRHRRRRAGRRARAARRSRRSPRRAAAPRPRTAAATVASASLISSTSSRRGAQVEVGVRLDPALCDRVVHARVHGHDGLV